ncbi:MAG: hypothetical protein A3I61_08315 [Acidobacteria bacterium RIFCSPLOWO2_02_FULL_68_18]|nr:MAG: hypothetical protein A3I61_08315 [Acidobacteria bacterium RIFCSPLOWO2_02_FULL_68_18]OFW51243.1 MAG: hypothetical protein A3G77_06410 [Acidobacteria bacterium RIFCSPLOWO2_12_FULL_68_19]
MAPRFVLLVAFVSCAVQPLLAQRDISGPWWPLPRNEDGSGMTGDAAGLPLGPEGRWRADSWSPEEFDVAEWVCRPHPWEFSLEGVLSQIHIRPEIDRATQKVVAYHGQINQMEQRISIWMDGRPRPPEHAVHTWGGFSTGEWDGDTLVVTTTHLKESYIRRSGQMRSDRSVIRTRYRRMGDYLQATVIVYDPVYLAEPYIRTTMMWEYDPAMRMWPYPCEEATETAVERGTVPHFLPGTSLLPGLNPALADDFATPYEARLGGPATMYPEYIARMKSLPRPSVPMPRGATESTSGQRLIQVPPR